ncbi:MAG: hypothetical protein RMK57_13565 [Bryobacterales bacterium]|nr:hypothetical protein [Bryobacteraceae bacterium]MDW8355547.1 hypothetical protein [Bryobacterales bacterium]
MVRRVLTGIKRFVLWDYPRACWQYDLMVALILAFVFLTPRGWFRDQPRAASVVMVHQDDTSRVFWIEAQFLAGSTPSQRAATAAELLRKRTGKTYQILRVEPIFDAASEIQGYLAVVRN